MREISRTSLQILTLLRELFPYHLHLKDFKPFIPSSSNRINAYLYWLAKRGLVLKYYDRLSKHYFYTISEDGLHLLLKRRTLEELKRIIEEVK
jgi:hypothetical protein